MFADKDTGGIAIYPCTEDMLEQVKSFVTPQQASWLTHTQFTAKLGTVALVPDESGEIALVVFGWGTSQSRKTSRLDFGTLPLTLPEGNYKLDARFAPAPDLCMQQATLGWLLGMYQFDKYVAASRVPARLVADENIDADKLISIAESAHLAQDLINTPANDMSPAHLEEATRTVAEANGAVVSVITGDDLLSHNYPMIHAVGRAGAIAPRLIDMRWGGNQNAPKLTLVGKGVCFDTGGLDIKPSSNMRLMKKDMGGAANILGLARIIMRQKLNVQLRVLIPAVENSIAGNAFRPGDILQTRKGLTVEVGNTDAEGRLVLADALVEADSENPDMLLDVATLTGAARVALGSDVMPYFTNTEDIHTALERTNVNVEDPLWRLPLWAAYESDLSSHVASTNNISSGGFAGAITAALFLQKFVSPLTKWAHFDIYGWTPKAKPARPLGGAFQAMRSVFAMLEERYGH